MFKRLLMSAIAISLAVLSTEALAESLTVKAEQTLVLKPIAKPGTIVIGNPSVADASYRNGKIFIFGRVYGSTNMILLDKGGKEISNYDITVVSADNESGGGNVSLYKAGARFSYLCEPNCQPVMQLGDDIDFYGKTYAVNDANRKFILSAPSSDGASNANNNGGANN